MEEHLLQLPVKTRKIHLVVSGLRMFGIYTGFDLDEEKVEKYKKELLSLIENKEKELNELKVNLNNFDSMK